MRRFLPWAVGGLVLLGVLAVASVSAQQGPLLPPGQRGPIVRPDQQGPVIAQTQQPLKVQVEMVHLFVTVRGKHDAIVPNLTKANFRVFEDGQEQKVAYFGKEMDLPLTLGLLIDTSGSQNELLGAEKATAMQFLGQVLTSKDLALVMTFDTDVDLLADFTNERRILDSAINRARINAPASSPVISQGPFPSSSKPMGTDFYDAIYLASHDKLNGQAGRKAIIVLTDAQDYGSTETLDNAIEAAQRADTVVHVILISDPFQYLYAGGYSGGGVASKLASQTGGRVIRVSNEKQLGKAFSELSQELRSQYVLGYYPSDATRDGSFRKVKVETKPDKYHVLTRDGYYAPSN